jgi:hypothetical protein
MRLQPSSGRVKFRRITGFPARLRARGLIRRFLGRDDPPVIQCRPARAIQPAAQPGRREDHQRDEEPDPAGDRKGENSEAPPDAPPPRLLELWEGEPGGSPHGQCEVLAPGQAGQERPE